MNGRFIAVGLPASCQILYGDSLEVLSYTISQKLCIESFCKSQFPHRPVSVSFIITDIHN